MKKIIFIVTLFILLLTPCFHAASQSRSPSSPPVFDTAGLPQWAKDLRRWDIIAFGSFPFSLLAVTFLHDLYRWNNVTGMDFSVEGRRYAPWPFKSAGAIELTSREQRTRIFLAIGFSAAIAFTDLLIVKTRQNRQRRNYTPASSGTVNIERRPYGVIEEDDQNYSNDADDSDDDINLDESPSE